MWQSLQAIFAVICVEHLRLYNNECTSAISHGHLAGSQWIVPTYERCRRLCSYQRSCAEFQFQSPSNCTMWNREVSSGPLGCPRVSGPCNVRPCSGSQVCVPVRGATSYICLKTAQPQSSNDFLSNLEGDSQKNLETRTEDHTTILLASANKEYSEILTAVPGVSVSIHKVSRPTGATTNEPRQHPWSKTSSFLQTIQLQLASPSDLNGVLETSSAPGTAQTDIAATTIKTSVHDVLTTSSLNILSSITVSHTKATQFLTLEKVFISTEAPPLTENVYAYMTNVTRMVSISPSSIWSDKLSNEEIEITTQANTASPDTNRYGDPCSVSTDCHSAHTQCIDAVCRCVAGYSFNPGNDSCTKNCNTYSSNFTLTSYEYCISGYNNGFVRNLNSFDGCRDKCIDAKNFFCRSFELWQGNCYLSTVTKLEVKSSSWKIWSGCRYHQRNCQ